MAIFAKVTSTDAFLAAGIAECRKITRRYGTSFYFATQFFPKDIRKGIYGIYAFARIPDEIVDGPDSADRRSALKKLTKWREEWREAMLLGSSGDPVMNAIVHTFKKFNIPSSDGEAFLRSMFMDEEIYQYPTWSKATTKCDG